MAEKPGLFPSKDEPKEGINLSFRDFDIFCKLHYSQKLGNEMETKIQRVREGNFPN